MDLHQPFGLTAGGLLTLLIGSGKMTKTQEEIMPEKSRYPNPWHPDDPVKFSVVKRSWSLNFPWDQVSKEMHTALERGKATMKCPYCGEVGIARTWCAKCTRMVTPDNWIIPSAHHKNRGKGRRSKTEIDKMFARL